jgi:Glyoxalase-like domain
LTFHVQTISIDCRDWRPLVDFWSAASDFGEIPDDPNNPGDPVGGLMDPSTGTRLLFIPVPEEKTIKNRVHFDVAPVDGTRDEEVERLVTLGATIVDDRRKPDGAGWVVMGDPEGNEFCVERSDKERRL